MTFSCGHKAVVVGHQAIPERLCADGWQAE
jgi:hypothetical protein